MADLRLTADELVLELSALEQLAALRGPVRVPRSAIEAVAVEPEPWRALRGIRAPGTGIPRVIAYGTRRLTGGRPDFAAVRGTGPAVRVELGPGSPFGRLLVTVADPAATVGRLTGR